MHLPFKRMAKKRFYIKRNSDEWTCHQQWQFGQLSSLEVNCSIVSGIKMPLRSWTTCYCCCGTRAKNTCPSMSKVKDIRHMRKLWPWTEYFSLFFLVHLTMMMIIMVLFFVPLFASAIIKHLFIWTSFGCFGDSRWFFAFFLQFQEQ